MLGGKVEGRKNYKAVYKDIAIKRFKCVSYFTFFYKCLLCLLYILHREKISGRYRDENGR